MTAASVLSSQPLLHKDLSACTSPSPNSRPSTLHTKNAAMETLLTTKKTPCLSTVKATSITEYVIR